MSLTSSLFSGISGMTTLGNSMQIIGDNISNVNTVGFKSSSYTFQDLLAQTVATQSGSSQVGRGTALGDISVNHVQGSFETTGNTTDLAIGGDGFFVLRESGTDSLFYTRAGNFRFDKDGYLTNPEGHVVQGWKLDENGDNTGAVTDILLNSFTSPPAETEEVTIITNLNSDAISQTSSLSNKWDSSQTTPIDPANYEYQTTVKAYDSLGNTHDVTIYYDKVAGTKWEYLITCNPSEDLRSLVTDTTSQGILARGTITFGESSGKIQDITMSRFTGLVGNAGYTGGSNTNENIHFTLNNDNAITADGHGFQLQFNGTTWSWANRPATYATASVISSNSQEIRINLDNDTNTPLDLTINLDRAAISSDIISFDVNSATSTGAPHVQDIANQQFTGDTVNNTTIEVNNYDAFLADDSGVTLSYNAAANSWSMAGVTAPEYASATISGNDNKVTIDLDNDGSADITATFDSALLADSTITFNLVGTTAWSAAPIDADGYYTFLADFLGGNGGLTEQNIEFNIGAKNDGTQWTIDSLTSTQYARASTTTFQSANGYGAGDLQSIDVDVDGVMTGIYSNGQLIPLYRVSLAKFLNEQGLFKLGGNLYRETRDSGAPITSEPGTNGLGSIAPNSLEQSNVDIASEFVKMITSQRGYQANSKIVTTVDTMLGETINMKR